MLHPVLIFSFDNDMYDQIDGVAMGSLLAPILANLFMGYCEKSWINSYTGNGPSYYRRYVDDIFALFDTETDAEKFYFMNTSTIKFTL